MKEQLKELLIKLRLHGMAECLDEVLTNAQRSGTAIDDVFLELLQAEHRHQQERALDNRIKKAKLPWPWTLDTFPFSQQPGVNKTQIMGLAKLNFVHKNENIVFIGKPGTGKSGLAMGLLRLALLDGKRGRFYNAQDMLDELYTSLADRSTTTLLKQLYNYDVLVIDELGYLTLNIEQINMFFKLIDMRYQKKPTIITTNLRFEDWYDIFKQKELVDAMLDRFKHYCTTITIEGPSLRSSENIIKHSNENMPKDKK